MEEMGTQRMWVDILVEACGHVFLVASIFSVKWELRSAAESMDSPKILWRYKYAKETHYFWAPSIKWYLLASFTWVKSMEARVQFEKCRVNVYKEQLPRATHVQLSDV